MANLWRADVKLHYRTLKPISGTGWDGWMDGWLSLEGAIYRAPTVLITICTPYQGDKSSSVQGKISQESDERIHMHCDALHPFKSIMAYGCTHFDSNVLGCPNKIKISVPASNR